MTSTSAPSCSREFFQTKNISSSIIKNCNFNHYIEPFVLGIPFCFLSRFDAFLNATARDFLQPQLCDDHFHHTLQKGVCNCQDFEVSDWKKCSNLLLKYLQFYFSLLIVLFSNMDVLQDQVTFCKRFIHWNRCITKSGYSFSIF